MSTPVEEGNLQCPSIQTPISSGNTHTDTLETNAQPNTWASSDLFTSTCALDDDIFLLNCSLSSGYEGVFIVTSMCIFLMTILCLPDEVSGDYWQFPLLTFVRCLFRSLFLFNELCLSFYLLVTYYLYYTFSVTILPPTLSRFVSICSPTHSYTLPSTSSPFLLFFLHKHLSS